MNLGAEKRIVVLLSGGLDSATVLMMAHAAGHACYALSVDYGQKHAYELELAAKIAAACGAIEHRIVKVDVAQFGGSALTDARIAVPVSRSDGIPLTYVPARNTIMLAVGLAWCEVLGADELHIGVNAIDYSGYPDCRPEFIEQFQRLATLATRTGVDGRNLVIGAPLQHMRKAEIIRTGTALGLDYSLTLSCYQPDSSGNACGACDACYLRREGFREAGIADPTRYL
jgi:7-cyano-7-deazaguanine synthase